MTKDGHDITLLTFEPPGQGKPNVNELRAALAADGIEWHWLRYHKRLSVFATAYDILRGAAFVRNYIRRNHVAILHSRVHVPQLMAVLARRFSKQKPRLLFDIRGFVFDEYADAGVWKPAGMLFRSAKAVEKRLLKGADGFVILTEKARDALFGVNTRNGHDDRGRPVEVIPCCVDFETRFGKADDGIRDTMRRRLGVGSRNVYIHVGALGGLYMTEEIVDFLAVARRANPNMFVVFLTQSDQVRVTELLRARGFADQDFLIAKVSPEAVPGYLCAADLALSFVRATYATISRSPTKIPEYLASGLPVLSNRGVGDVDALIEGQRVGVLTDDFDDASYKRALSAISALRLDPNLAERCRRTARDKFDLGSVGGARYRRLYRRLLND